MGASFLVRSFGSGGLWRPLHIASLALALGGALSGCSILDTEIPRVDEEDYDDFTEDVAAVLRELFPALSEAEIAELSTTLSFDEVVALREELEEVREAAAEFSLDLFQTSEERVAERAEALEPENDGYPSGLGVVGSSCRYDEAAQVGVVNFSGVFQDKTAVQLAAGEVSVLVNGEAVAGGQLSCLASGETVDIVFLIDITGSMSNVIASVRDSVVRFVDAIEASGVTGTISVVSFQDTVGVDVTFQEPAPSSGVERSPFFRPVPISDGAKISDLRAFVNRLEANAGADLPENLSAAVDFARSSVIGRVGSAPNVIDGSSDPPSTSPFPGLTSERQVFVALTDATFHSDSRDEGNSSLQAAFVPRPAEEILATLTQTGTTVHVIDPSWVDESLDPAAGAEVDADYWAIHTGGVGEDTVLGYSLVDLELVVVAEDTGLLDVALDGILASSCSFEFSADLSAEAEVEVRLDVGGEVFTDFVAVTAF